MPIFKQLIFTTSIITFKYAWFLPVSFSCAKTFNLWKANRNPGCQKLVLETNWSDTEGYTCYYSKNNRQKGRNNSNRKLNYKKKMLCFQLKQYFPQWMITKENILRVDRRVWICEDGVCRSREDFKNTFFLIENMKCLSDVVKSVAGRSRICK